MHTNFELYEHFRKAELTHNIEIDEIPIDASIIDEKLSPMIAERPEINLKKCEHEHQYQV
jgi:hypothetical protein